MCMDLSFQLTSHRDVELPMGLLKANHIIEQDCSHYDGSIKIDNGDFYKVPLCVTI